MNFALAQNIVLYLLVVIISACGGGSGSNSATPAPETPQGERVAKHLFGINLAWNNLAESTIEHGEQIQDRSFRLQSQSWLPIESGGTVSFSANGGDLTPAGETAYPGYATLSRNDSNGTTCVAQQLQAPIKNGRQYQVNFSAQAATGVMPIELILFDSNYNPVVSDMTLSASIGWTKQQSLLTANKDTSGAILAICLSAAGSVDVDEVRFSTLDTLPVVKEVIKTRILELGATTLRYPGGSLLDDFDWKQSVGSVLQRGELSAYAQYQTPSLGLHEFLDLCEELGVQPLLGINVLDTPQSAADLLEYIYGDSTTIQGALRIANGRSQPWSNANLFEIGNEPVQDYKGSGALSNAGVHYAFIAIPIIQAMKAKAAELNASIQLSGINEPSFQLADWLLAGSEIGLLLYDWNAQVFDNISGIGALVDMTHGHFYSYHGYHTTAKERFEYVMAGGALLRKSLVSKVNPAIGEIPLWLTEYNTFLKDDISIYPEFNKDYQTGLEIADLIMTMADLQLPAAYIWNLSESNSFGILTPAFGLRPSGIIFKLFSVIAEEKKLPVELISATSDVDELFTVTTGAGNIPSGFQYKKITALATLNTATSNPRVFILNKNFDTDINVSPKVAGYSLDNAIVSTYTHADLSANNETTADSVKLISTTMQNMGGVLVPKHSLVMIEYQ